MKLCKDGRVWGQNNKEAKDHLGVLTGRRYKNLYVKKGFNPNSKGKPFIKGYMPWIKGKFHSGISKQKMSEIHKGKHHSPETEFKKGMIPYSKLHPEVMRRSFTHPFWKGGISKNRKLYSQLRLSRMRMAGELTIKTIQKVYEDNIKQFGTLTCYLCLKPIPFGKDHLEHKIPISKGGQNNYENLGISCQGCNCRKCNKTVEEFLLTKKEE